jgi:hypothetical protein
MRRLTMAAALGGIGLMAAGCATTDNYASACERDYQRNRERAATSGALLGAAAGAAIAGPGDRERGAALGAAIGGLLGHQLSAEEDPCGYGFGGYNRDYRYGRDRIYWQDSARRW